MKRICVALLTLVCLGLIVADSSARTLELEPAKVAVISPSDNSNTSELLMKFAMPEVLSGHSVDFANLTFQANCGGQEDAVVLQAFALTRDWDEETVSWTMPWQTRGGDCNKRSSAHCISEKGCREPLQFDLTDVVNGWLEEPSKNFGVLVKVSGPFSGGLSTDKSQGSPKLSILY
ncbi:MAG: DNRLRE domain-containing protein [Candidatus Eisenbacteria bacterium]|nr:DNRLRE domain-containing protein [Candidatus Eisenbacteria bacterium]